MKKLFVFDLDGTLVNSLYDLGDAMNHVLKSHGMAVHEYEKYKYFVGNGTLKLVERAVSEEFRTPERIEALHKEFADNYRRCALNKTRPYEGITQLLETLKGKGAKLAVASNKPDEFTKLIVNTLFRQGLFDAVSGKQEGSPTKPAPDIMYRIMDQLGVSAEESIHSGDSDVDVLTAHNAGMECIGCTWGFRTAEELERAGADYIVDKPEEITVLVEGDL